MSTRQSLLCRQFAVIAVAACLIIAGCDETEDSGANPSSQQTSPAVTWVQQNPAPAESPSQVQAAAANPKEKEKEPKSELEKLFDEYFALAPGSASFEQTRPIAEKIIESNDHYMINELSWDIMNEKNIDDSKRDYEIALKAAEKANALTNGKSPFILDTYALALYKNGKLKEAVDTQQKAYNRSFGCMRAPFRAKLQNYKKQLSE